MGTEDAVREDPYTKMAADAARGARVTAIGTLASAALAAVKILAGLVGNSYALIADGIESLLDILSALAVWGSLKIAVSPPSARYPYGYGKVEPLAALIVAMILLVAAAGIAIQSVREIVTPHHGPAAFTLFVLIGVVAVKEVMFRMLSRAGRSIGSLAVQTDAWHHRSDALTSLAAFVGISVALIGGKGYESADDWAALFACGVIVFNGSRLLRSALREVLDAAPGAEIARRVRQVAAAVAEVRAIEKCRVRRSGLGLFCDVHVVVDGQLPVHEGHRIAHEVKDALLAGGMGILDVAVHIEPAGEPGESGAPSA
ncbi:MAG: cation diffusion facilitator family transporter [Planctomycetota bacterium]|jgi:cation diffusion facilitator family transporter